MAVTTGTVLIAAVTVLGAMGAVFEIGRRLGRTSKNHDTMSDELEDIDNRLANRFSELERRLDREAAMREREREVLLGWLEELTKALLQEGYDVERPAAVQENIDLDGEIFPESGD